MRNVTVGSSRTSENTLSLAWVMTGVVLFATALGAPLAVVQLQGDGGWQSAEQSEASAGKPVATASREAQVPSGPTPIDEPLTALLGQGEIVPGVGIGPVLLDTEIRDVLALVEEPSTLSYALSEAGLEANHQLSGADFNLTVAADPGLGLINAVTLSAPDCASLRDFQPREEGLPATEEGLSLGSHVSRVRQTLGAPHAQSPAEGEPPRVEHSYPGIRLSYCAQDMVVSGISVERLPPAPLLAPTDQDRPAPEPMIAALHDGTTLSGAPARRPTATPEAPQAAPLYGGPVSVPQIRTQPTVGEPAIEEPAALLAMNGGAFTAGDAFSAPRQPRDGRIFARAAVPPELVLAVVRASVAEETNAEFQGVTEFVANQAEETEADLRLTRLARGRIQRRLELIGYDPKGVDGIFGPNTREGIAALQTDGAWPQPVFSIRISSR